MKKLFIYNWLPMLFAAMATFSFTACGGSDGDDTDYAALAAMQGALGGGAGNIPGIDSRAVDLGLSVKWASCNVGATQPWEYGGYYAWGETEEKNSYSSSNYKHTKYMGPTNIIPIKYYSTVDNKTTLDPEDDVAHVKWGGYWRMPTRAEQDELRNKCTWTWTTLNGVNGFRVTGPNGNSIFLPAAGSRRSNGTYYTGSNGVYQSSSLYGNGSYCYVLAIADIYRKAWCDSHYRHEGLSVRPVCP